MVIMLRAEGIPARIAVGYSMGNYDSSRGAYQVIASDAHAWVEAFFPGFGWIEFEPTPSQSTFTFGESSSSLDNIAILLLRPITLFMGKAEMGPDCCSSGSGIRCVYPPENAKNRSSPFCRKIRCFVLANAPSIGLGRAAWISQFHTG